MIDIHMHVIPGVDDGSRSYAMSVEMLEMAYAQGIDAVIATPHSSAFRDGGEKVRQAFSRLRKSVKRLYPSQRFLLGCEVRCEPGAMGATLERLKAGVYPSMNGTACVLAEFGEAVMPEDALDIADALEKEGWRPIIAHAERYGNLFLDGGTAIKALLERGCLIQVNAYSLSEEKDPVISGHARQLLERQQITFLGSDAHRLDHRAPSAARGLEYVYRTCGTDYTDAVAFGNAERLLFRSPGNGS